MRENIMTSLANGLCRLAIRLIRLCEPYGHVECKYVKRGRNKDKKKITETCEICFEDVHVDQMLQITRCHHSYCLSCMSNYVQSKLLQGVLPKCPHENCNTTLKLNSCKKFLDPRSINLMSERFKEALIHMKDRIYCPNPRCSSLFSKEELQQYKGGLGGARTCPNCNAMFCVKCKVPWHDKMSCSDYKRQNPHASREERALQALAARKRWRPCPNCSNMVSRTGGCLRISCRCGHPFCYTCGGLWIVHHACKGSDSDIA